MDKTFEILEFNKIREMLTELACTEAAKEQCRTLGPSLSQSEVSYRERETTEARLLLDEAGFPPLMSLAGMRETIQAAVQGQCLSAEELESLERMLAGVSRLKIYLNRTRYLEAGISYYDENLDECLQLREKIGSSLRNGRVMDSAGKYLESLRRDIQNLDEQIRKKLETILRSCKSWVSESYVTMKNGRFCIPLKKEYKSRLSGTVISQSSTGTTIFVEPAAIGELSLQLSYLQIEEENEERRILYELSGMAADQEMVLLQNIGMIEKLDFLFAKGKLSQIMDGTEPEINTDRRIEIEEGRHPFIKKEDCVPLNLNMGETCRGVIITGPNTGGKTVAVKTVGLLL